MRHKIIAALACACALIETAVYLKSLKLEDR